MKYNKIALALGVTCLLGLAGCGGGGGGSADSADDGNDSTPTTPAPTTPKQTESVDLFLGLSQNDDYLGSVTDGKANLSLFKDETTIQTFATKAIYQKGNDTVTFARNALSDKTDTIIINGYQFYYQLENVGALVTVTEPNGDQAFYMLDENNKVISDEEVAPPADENEATGNYSCALSMSRDDSPVYQFCYEFSHMDAEYCTVENMNQRNDGNNYSYASFSDTQSCYERGYVNFEDDKIWSKGSLLRSSKVMFRNSSVASSSLNSCDGLNNNDVEQVARCVLQQVNALLVHLPQIQSGLSDVVKAYDIVLSATFDEAFNYVTAIPELAEDSKSQTVASSAEYFSDALNDIDNSDLQAKLIELHSSLSDLFDDIDVGELKTSYLGLGELSELLSSDGEGLDKTEIPSVPTEPSEPLPLGEISCKLHENNADDGGTWTKLECTTTNSEGHIITNRDELIQSSPSASNVSVHAIDIRNTKYLTVAERGTLITASERLWIQERINDYESKMERAYYDQQWDYSIGETITTTALVDIHNTASITLMYNQSQPLNNNSVSARKGQYNIHEVDVSETCFFNPQSDPELSAYTKSEFNSSTNMLERVVDDKRICPFSLTYSDDMTSDINDLVISDMWLKTGEYQQYLVQE